MSRINVRVINENGTAPSFHDLPSPDQITYVRWLCARIMEKTLTSPQPDIRHNIDALRNILYSMGEEFNPVMINDMDRYATAIEARYRTRGVLRGK